MKIEITPHPAWIEEFIDFIAPYNHRIVNSRYCSEMAAGTLSMKRFRGGLLNFWPLIEDFPIYLALIHKKVSSDGNPHNRRVREWLAGNIRLERKHTGWYRQWATDFGVPSNAFEQRVIPSRDMDAVNNYLWRVGTQGSVIEGLSAISYAIEGPCGQWCKRVKPNIRAYETQPGITFRKGTLKWINAHARYDDTHPVEALELIKAFATTKQERISARLAAQRSMEYYAMAVDACYDIFA